VTIEQELHINEIMFELLMRRMVASTDTVLKRIWLDLAIENLSEGRLLFLRISEFGYQPYKLQPRVEWLEPMSIKSNPAYLITNMS